MSLFSFSPMGEAHTAIVSEVVYVRGQARSVRRAYRRDADGAQCGVGFIVDDDFPVCMVCCRGFTWFFRRHHCRACGNIVCDLCSPLKVAGERVCVQCYYGQSPQHADSHQSFFASVLADTGSDDEHEPWLSDGDVGGSLAAAQPAEEWVSVFAARTGRDVDTVLELHGVYLQLAGRDSTGADARNLVLLKGLLDWAPLASALSSNVVTAADVIGCCDRRRDDDSDKGAAHMLLSFAEFLELVLELQTLIDQFSEMMPAQTDARRGPSFGPDEAAMARFEALLSATTAAPPHRRSSLLKAKSEMLGLRGEEMRSEPLDKESSILDLKMKSFAGNLRKQDARHSSKWRFRRVIFSGLILSYFSGHDQKGAFSLKGQNARAALGRSVSAADLETLGGPTSVRDMPLVQSSYGPVYVITPNCDELVRRLDLEPCSFTVYTDAGNYSNFIAETQEDAEHWVEVISHNLELSDKIASRNSAFFGDKHVPKMLSIKEE